MQNHRDLYWGTPIEGGSLRLVQPSEHRDFHYVVSDTTACILNVGLAIEHGVREPLQDMTY